MKTTYTRFYKDQFNSFEEFLESWTPKIRNHKVIGVEKIGYEDVYDITVEKYHNFALSAGVFVHNCIVGYDDNLTVTNPIDGLDTEGVFIIQNSWGTRWGDNGFGYLPYMYVLAGQANDIWSTTKHEYLESIQL